MVVPHSPSVLDAERRTTTADLEAVTHREDVALHGLDAHDVIKLTLKIERLFGILSSASSPVGCVCGVWGV